MEARTRLIAPLAALLVSLVVLPGRADTAYLLESESPSSLAPLTLSVRVVGGYESGYIPDALCAVELGLGILDKLHVEAGVVAAYLTGPGQIRLSSYSVAPHFDFWKGARSDAVSAYLKLTHTVGAPVIMDYPGALTDVGSVVSPRADVGLDVGGGVTGLFSLPSGPAFLFDLSYARTELRGWYPLFTGESYRNRVFANLVPAFIVGDSLLIGAQNRLTWWFDRGFMYDLLPQINWRIAGGFTLSAGVGVPVVGGGVWKAYGSLSVDVGTEELFLVVREGENIRLRVYLSFLGDKADLFEPQNKQFGARNTRIMASVARFIRRYPGYRIVVEGHTNRAKLDMSFEKEQREEMLPLARARAAAVKDALVRMGFDARRLGTVAYGGLRPLAKFEDMANNWRNRRVEILLVKEATAQEDTR